MLWSILGKRWRFLRVPNMRYRGEKVDGLCDFPTATGKAIRLDSRLTGERELTVVIHECLHAAGWHLEHDYVTDFSEDLARILYQKLGYRREC